MIAYSMQYPEYKYIATAINGINVKRRVISLNEFDLPSQPGDCYRSWCRYTQEYYDHWYSNDYSVAGFQGNSYTDFIPIDIDNNDLNISLKTCQDFIKEIECIYEIPIEALNIYFSGKKGFHVEIPITLFGDLQPSTDLPYRIKNVVRTFGYDDIDLSIYKNNHLLRIPNSINSKSNLYKIPLTHQEIEKLTLKQILALATKPRNFQYEILSEDWVPRDPLVHLWNNSNEQSTTIDRSDLTLEEHHGVEKGIRNKTAFDISRQLFSRGHNVEQIKEYIVNEWNPKNNPPETNLRSLRRTVESAHGYRYSDSGFIAITKHFRTDPYFKSFNNDQQVIYLYIISHLNEIEKIAWGKFSCKPNQLIFSYYKLAEKTNTGEQVVRTLIKKLIEWGRIEVKILYHKGKVECSRLTFFPFSLKPLTNTLTNTQSLVDKQ